MNTQIQTRNNNIIKIPINITFPQFLKFLVFSLSFILLFMPTKTLHFSKYNIKYDYFSQQIINVFLINMY